MNYFEDLPEELLDIIISYLSTADKINLRKINKNSNNLINYMHIKIDKFDEKYNKVIIPFRVSNIITQYMLIGMMIEWRNSFCWYSPSKRNRQRKPSKITTREKMKESIYEIGSVYASEWLYEAVINWSIVENCKYSTIK